MEFRIHVLSLELSSCSGLSIVFCDTEIYYTNQSCKIFGRDQQQIRQILEDCPPCDSLPSQSMFHPWRLQEYGIGTNPSRGETQDDQNDEAVKDRSGATSTDTVREPKMDTIDEKDELEDVVLHEVPIFGEKLLPEYDTPPDGGTTAWLQVMVGHIVIFNTWGCKSLVSCQVNFSLMMRQTSTRSGYFRHTMSRILDIHHQTSAGLVPPRSSCFSSLVPFPAA